MRFIASIAVMFALFAAPVAARDAAEVPAPPAPVPLGVSYSGWKGEYRAAAKRLETFKAIGFQIVSFVPTYAVS